MRGRTVNWASTCQVSWVRVGLLFSNVLVSGDDLSFPAFSCCRGHITGIAETVE